MKHCFKEKNKRQEKKKTKKKRVGKEGHSYCHSPQIYEGHSHIAPVDKKEWHSSFARNLGSGARERRSKECHSCTHCISKLTDL